MGWANIQIKCYGVFNQTDCEKAHYHVFMCATFIRNFATHAVRVNW